MNDTSAFLLTPGLSGLVQQLSHLSQFGSDALVIEGEEGSGRSSLLNHLREHFEQHQTLETPITLAAITASSASPSQNILMALASELGLGEDQVSSGALISKLRSYSEALVRDKQLAIAFVDSASSLDDQSLGAMLSLLQHDFEQDYGLKLIFFGDIGFARRVDDIGMVDIVVYDFQIPQMSSDELGELLTKRFPDYQDLSDTQKLPAPATLWQRSGGLPGPAIALVEDAMLPEDTKSNIATDIVKMPVLHLVLVSVLFAGLLLMFFYRGNDKASDESTLANNQPPTQIASQEQSEPSALSETAIDKSALYENEELNQSSIEATTSAQTSDQVAAVTVVNSNNEEGEKTNASASYDNEQSSDDVIPTERAKFIDVVDTVDSDANTNDEDDSSLQDAKSLAQVFVSEKNQIDTSSLKPSLTAPTAVDLEEQSVEKIDGALTVTESNKTNISVTSTKTNVESTEQKSNGEIDDLTSDEVRVLAVSDSAFFLQLLAASRKGNLEDFVASQENRDELALYRKTRDTNQTWFVVVVGPYASRTEAQQAVEALPSDQRKSTPWLRNARAVKNEIRRYHGLPL